MDTTTLPSTIDPGPRVRALTWIGTALGLLVLSASLLWLVAPELSPYASVPNPAPVHHLLPDPGAGRTAAAGLQAIVGAAASAVGLAALFGRRGLTSALAGIAVACGLLGAIGLIGLNGLAIAGYTLAHSLPLLVVLVLVLTMRTRAARAVTAVAGLAACAALVASLAPLRSLYLDLGVWIVDAPVRFATPLVLLLFSGIWMLVGAMQLLRAPGALGRFALRYRVAITVLAASCALPYVLARLTWLTPWPQFGDPGTYDDVAQALANGLILGLAMLAGGVLTLGLVRPWGSRFPRWAGRYAGRPVPVALAVVPASIVAVLFTSAGLDSLLLADDPGTGLAIARATTAIIFPFWLWGPLLGLATWAYALHRRADADIGADAPAPRPPAVSR